MVNSDVVIPAGSQVLLNVRSASSVNGGTTGDYTYSYSEVNFGKNDSLSLVAGSTTVDSVSYTFQPSRSSMAKVLHCPLLH